jgi:hypothetical protein
MANFAKASTVGFEIDPALSFLRQTYPDRMWLDGRSATARDLDSDLLICSDVIEHLEAPEELLSLFANSKVKKFVISTPALEILSDRGLSPKLGPPANPSHIMEWTTNNFASFVQKYCKILSHTVTNCSQCTQMIIAEHH